MQLPGRYHASRGQQMTAFNGLLGFALEKRKREAESLARTTPVVEKLIADLEEKLPRTFHRRAE